MKSITIQASERRITCVKINEDGDLVFTAGIDGSIAVWRTKNGRRLGTYHMVRESPFEWTAEMLKDQFTKSTNVTRAVTHIDVNRNTTELAACVFDSVLLFEVTTGKLLDIIQEDCLVQCCEWNRNRHTQNMLLVGVTNKGKQTNPKSFKILVRASDHEGEEIPEYAQIPAKAARMSGEGSRDWYVKMASPDFEGQPTVCGWGPLDQFVIGGTTDGKLFKWNLEGKTLDMKQAHQAEITAIAFNKNRSICVTASRDKSAKVWNTLDFSLIREIVADRPLNAVSLHPNESTVIMAGGQAAIQVTTSDAEAAYFELLVIDLLTGEEQARALLHYSPTLCLCYHPEGNKFVTGSYEGRCKIVTC